MPEPPIANSDKFPGVNPLNWTTRVPDATEFFTNAQKIANTQLQEGKLARIQGNAPIELKELAVKWFKIFSVFGSFVRAERERLEVTAVEVFSEVADEVIDGSVSDTGRKNVRLILEIDVRPEMCNAEGKLDHGCMAWLLDEGSSVVLVLRNALDGNLPYIMGVSQALNIRFYGHAVVGSRLRVINTSVAANVNSAGGTAKTEIWDLGAQKLVVSCEQFIMPASSPRENPMTTPSGANGRPTYKSKI